MVGGGLFPSPPVTKKSPTPTEKSPTVISKRCWTLEYSGELEFSSPFMEQWTLDARGVLFPNIFGFDELSFSLWYYHKVLLFVNYGIIMVCWGRCGSSWIRPPTLS